MPVVWLWLAMSLVGTVWTIRLLRRARSRAASEHGRPADHPVRILTEARVRNQWLWLLAIAGGLLLGVLVLLRDVLPFEVPPGVSVVVILWLMGTAMAVQLLDDHDDRVIGQQQKHARGAAE